jgi:adenylyltransferase/sulfurtransferase
MCQGWGEEGQERIRAATVFIAGVGGLGGPVSLYLAAAGVGKLRICDNGQVELSNLNRQILYNDHDIHSLKVVSARNFLTRFNPYIEVEYFPETMTRQTIGTLVGDATIMVDCLDNFETRYILNDYGISKRLSLVHAGVEGLTGQITFIHSPETPCLRCVIPEGPPPQKTFPILGTTAGIIGCLEANEVLKHLTGIGTPLKGKLLIWDGLESEFHSVDIGKDPRCPVCGGA